MGTDRAARKEPVRPCKGSEVGAEKEGVTKRGPHPFGGATCFLSAQIYVWSRPSSIVFGLGGDSFIYNIAQADLNLPSSYVLCWDNRCVLQCLAELAMFYFAYLFMNNSRRMLYR